MLAANNAILIGQQSSYIRDTAWVAVAGPSHRAHREQRWGFSEANDNEPNRITKEMT